MLNRLADTFAFAPPATDTAELLQAEAEALMLAVGAAEASVGTPTGWPSAPVGTARTSAESRLRGVTSLPCASRTTTG
eukprot:scaffold152408_cov33-Tisochrysis_lutea.AAC.1